ncbi:MAG: 16S rRNA (adenine(1518)-N(6)/adenine(1519)-N(6))-dimethyltransferase RsmA [bacterium]|nr:16S rRNA (adenine(1518)-N(6)/adenine(1519)-N(6))-dimethyltransferase RsmA [bacterium]
MRQNRRNAKVGVGARLGQHFLKSPWAARALARAAGIGSDDTVLEIGPGRGALTRELLAVSQKVVAIEKDEALAALLNEKFSNEIQSGALTVIAGDVRDVDTGKPGKIGRYIDLSGQYIVAANIPYYITGEIIRQFLTTARQPRAMALLVQKEVARRIVSNKESLLSLSVKAYGNPKVVIKVPRGNFSPPPNVDSAVLLIENISRKFFSNLDEELFFKVLHAGFKSKRKFLLNNLADSFGKDEVTRAFAQCEINPKARAEDVPLIAWQCIAKQLLASRD